MFPVLSRLRSSSIRNVFSKKLLFSQQLNHISKRRIQMKIMSEEEYEMKRVEFKEHLPVSPHVTIYKFPLPAISSITHRFTGISLAVGYAAMGLVAAVNPDSVQYLVDLLNPGGVMTFLTRSTVAFSLFYHYINAFRHFMWDTKAIGLETREMDKSSKLVFLSATGVSSAVVLLSYMF